VEAETFFIYFTDIHTCVMAAAGGDCQIPAAELTDYQKGLLLKDDCYDVLRIQ
jgi:hypothetical protein